MASRIGSRPAAARRWSPTWIPVSYTFMLRAVGSSDNDTSTSGDIPGVVSRSDTVTVPMPTPTLPEIAMLFLAMLLLGSGAYLLRRRQSGGLTHA